MKNVAMQPHYFNLYNNILQIKTLCINKMNLDIDCDKLLGYESDGISILEPSQKKYLKVYNYVKLCEIIDLIGNSSANVNFGVL